MGVDNNVSLTGRLTKDLELKSTKTNISYMSFTIAVQRGYDKEKADFINCTIWRQSAEFLAKYGKKGDMVSVLGEIQTDSYEGEHGLIYKTYVNANDVKIRTKTKPNESDEVPETIVAKEEPKKDEPKKELAKKKEPKKDDDAPF